MKAIREKIDEERIKTSTLRSLTKDVDYDTSKRIMKEQEEHWDKFNFFKELNKAVDKKEGRSEKNG